MALKLQAIRGLLSGKTMQARVVRGSMFTIASYGGAQALRLASNLILTRILFPEAFGLMAIVSVIATGLEMFSDTGVNASIVQSKRGNERVFLDTAWTFQILRGVLLWVTACLIAGAVADFYELQQMAQLLPVAAFSTVIMGFMSTNMATANKKIMLGRLTVLELGCQLLGLIVTVGLALWWGSVWALIFGGLVAKSVKVILSHRVLPGDKNSLTWNWDVFWELFHFGKYIIVGSIAGFLVNIGDRAILGKFVSLTDLAVYNIGWLLASLPMALSRVFGRKILFPIYAAKPPSESAENRRKIAQARYILTGCLMVGSLCLGIVGDWLVQVLYLPEYHLAGPVLVLVAIGTLPTLILSAYGGLLLGTGNSRDFTTMLIATALVQTAFLYFGVREYGLLGAILAPGLALIIVYPLTVYLVRRNHGWNPIHDALFFALGLGIAAIILWLHPTAIFQILAGSGR